MANTYSQIYIHFVFSTKNRQELIHREIESRIWAYMGGVCKKHTITPIQIGGIEDHAHGLLGLPTTLSVSMAAKHLKGDSSFGIRRDFPGMSNFGWQDGYGAFSVSKDDLPRVIEYIRNQREHHTKQSFENEYRELLKFHGIDFDEKYLFD